MIRPGRKLLACLLPMLSLCLSLHAQEKHYMGWQRSLHGGGFGYHSPQPDVDRSLLIRSLSAKDYIEWETEAVPGGPDGVSFVWMFGIDANPDSHAFTLWFNGQKAAVFHNPLQPEKRDFAAACTGGFRLVFRTTMIDKYNDPMGYAILHVPENLIKAGMPQQIRITGEDAGSRSWYMTFEAGVREEMRLEQAPAVVKRGPDRKIPVFLQITHLGEETALEVKVRMAGTGQPLASFTGKISTGYNQVELLLPRVEKETSCLAVLRKGTGKDTVIPLTLVPPPHYTVYLVQHAHTDIGYTRPQTEILPEHLRFIDFALDFCDRTDDYPPESRFRWTCETSWPVREYLWSRPARQIERLLQRIREGRIEVTGLFLNMSDMFDENIIRNTLIPVDTFSKYGIPVQTAMQNDVNGAAWCLADLLPALGIRYFMMGQNTHRAQKPFSIPAFFRWEGPQGGRLLTFCGEHYMQGNFLGILNGETESFGRALFSYLKTLHDKGYPYDQHELQFSGYLTDNAPPSTTACHTVTAWNTMYEWPRLRLATAGEFMRLMDSLHGNDFPVIRGAWPDWWMDGFGSTAVETAYARRAHCDLLVNERLTALCEHAGFRLPAHAAKLRTDIVDDLCFWDEHTFTAAESISDPLAENTIVQWGQKSAFAWDAVKKNSLWRECLTGFLLENIHRDSLPQLVVFNALGRRSGTVEVYIDHELIPQGAPFHFIADAGDTAFAQPLQRRDDGTYWSLYVNDIPELGSKAYRLHRQPGMKTPAPGTRFDGVMENAWYLVEFDTVRGGIKRLYDKELKLELADPSAPYLVGELIHEKLGKNRTQLESLRLDEVTRSGLQDVSFGVETCGEVWQAVSMTGEVPGSAATGGFRAEFRLYRTEKKIELVYAMKKLAVTDPEAVYVAFPLQLKDGKVFFAVQGGDVEAGRGQLPGSSMDWFAMQDYVAVAAPQAQVVISSPEVPLVMAGGLNLGRFSRMAVPEKPHLYSWVLNNYWTTNFLASREGELRWTYRVTSAADTSVAFREQAGRNFRMPFVVKLLPGK